MLKPEIMNFLQEKNLEFLICVFEEKKIDDEVIILMTDEELAEYIPSYGQRVLIRNICQRLQDKNTKPRKQSLLSSLRKRFKLSQGTEELESRDEESMRHVHVKAERNIELGWLHFNEKENRYVQVRARNGGGSRKIKVRKDVKKAALIERGKSLFFPDGMSPKGDVDDFCFDIMDFKENLVDDEETVGELYQKTMLPTLRFYLATKVNLEKTAIDNSSDKVVSDIAKEMGSTSNPGTSAASRKPDVVVTASTSNLAASVASNGIAATGSSRRIVPGVEDTCDWRNSESKELPFPSLGLEVEVPYELCEEDTDLTNDESVVQFAPFEPAEENEGENDDTLAYIPNEAVEESPMLTLVVKRNQVLNDMLEYFSDQDILRKEVSIRMIGLDGLVEKGVGDGVGRDCLTEFWSEFKDSCTIGSTVKVPYLRHDFGQTKWEAVGRVVVYGWRKFGYFPVWLAPPFMQVAICDKVTSSVIAVREVFLDYVSEIDRDILAKALKDFSSVDFDDIVDALSSYNCRKIPTKQNITSLVDEIAHKELVQEPMYVAKCFMPILNRLQADMPKINHIQQDLKPKAKKILKLLQFPDEMTQAQVATAEYLKQFIKNLDQHYLALLLRFCTGSDLLLAPYITVTFIEQSDFARHPIAHTCTFALELPFSYDSFPQFRSEFKSILQSGMWVMDME